MVPSDAKPGLPVATYAYALAHSRLVRQRRLVVASPGLEVKKSPTFAGEPAGRVCDGDGTVLDMGNEIGCISVIWHQAGDRTNWTRASNGEFDVITSEQGRY